MYSVNGLLQYTAACDDVVCQTSLVTKNTVISQNKYKKHISIVREESTLETVDISAM